MKPRTSVGLFAGIGGLEAGLAKSGFHASMLCEIDPAAKAVLEDRFRKAELVSDVKDIDTVGKVNVLCAGFPCQDLSSVGKKVGIDGNRSGLVDEVFRILAASDAEWVLVENVKFMLHLNQGEAMERITSGFEKLGYRWAYRVVNSQAFGVPQRRHRVFFVATRTGDPRAVLLSDDAQSPVKASIAPRLGQHIGFYWTEGSYASGIASEAIPPLKAGSTIGIPSPPAILFPDGFVGTPHIEDAERLQGFPPGWTEAATLVGRASARWRLLGNAVTVPVAEWIGKRIVRPKRYSAVGDLPIIGKWPPAAWCMGGGRFEARVSDWPVDMGVALLADFLERDAKALSTKAVNGFLMRAAKGNLTFPGGFLSQLAKFVQHEVKYDAHPQLVLESIG